MSVFMYEVFPRELEQETYKRKGKTRENSHELIVGMNFVALQNIQGPTSGPDL